MPDSAGGTLLSLHLCSAASPTQLGRTSRSQAASFRFVSSADLYLRIPGGTEQGKDALATGPA